MCLLIYYASFFLVIIIIISIESSASPCETITDCFNCSMSTANCYWTKTKCISSKNAPEIEEWWNTFDNCNDLSSLSIINKYCGDFTKLEDTYTLSLSRVNGRYGDSNLFCSYLYKAGKNNDQLTVKIPNNIDNDITKLELLVFYLDTESVQRLIVTSTDEKFVVNKVALLEMFFLIKEPMTLSPFDITFIEEANSLTQVWVYIVIIVLAVLFPITVIFICFYTQSVLRKSRRAIEQVNTEVNPLESQNSSHSEAQRIKILIDNLFKKELKPIKYDKNIHLKFGAKCTICLEDLKTEELICITRCQHVFHYDCISHWLYKNGDSVRCPNCNQDLQEKKDKENVRDTNFIVITRTTLD